MKPYSLILWDFDGTLYEETPQIKEDFARSARRAVRNQIQEQLHKCLYTVTTDETIDSLLKQSREMYGDSFTLLALGKHSEEKRGLGQLSEQELHRKHHENLNSSLLKPNEKLVDAFVRLEQAGVASAIVTHGHMIWTKKALERCGLSPFFPEDKIVTAEKINFKKKHRDIEAFSLALQTMGMNADNLDPESVMFVEDKAKNLFFPKNDFKWTTCLITPEHKKNLSHVDVQCAAPEDVIDLVIKYNLMVAPDRIAPEPVV